MTRTDRSAGRGRIAAARQPGALAWWRLGPRLSLAVAAIAVVGCDHSAEPFSRVAVNGTVALDEQPLDAAVIRFVPTGSTAGPKTSFEIRQGRFAASREHGPPVGTHRVEVEVVDPRWRHDDEEAIQRLSRSRTRKIDRVRLPDAYCANSLLTVTFATPPSDSDDHSPQTVSFSLSSRLR